jgi:hypothetical protein
MENPRVVDSGPEFESLIADNHELAQIIVATDGGPWAMHNFPCPVCQQRAAILNLNTGIFEPCGIDKAKGWELVQRRKNHWTRLTGWLRKGEIDD